jgi:non-ribosomal peptide synthetase component F
MPLEAPSGTAKFELSLFAAEADEGLQLTLEYSSDLFEPATVDRMLAHFRVLLVAVVAQPDRPVGALPMLTEQERHQVLAGWGAGGDDEGSDPGDFDDLPAGFEGADEAELDALLDQLSPNELSNDE